MGVKVIKKVAGVPSSTPATPVIDMQQGAESEPAHTPLKMVKGHVAVGTVEKQYSSGGTESISEKVAEVVSEQATCNVGVSMAFTKNLGNYESLKVSVSLFMPCIPTPEEIEDTYEEVKGWVDGKISAIQSEVSEQVGH